MVAAMVAVVGGPEAVAGDQPDHMAGKIPPAIELYMQSKENAKGIFRGRY